MTRPNIHIVDDDPDIRDGLAWLFDSRGYQASTWDGGQPFLLAAQALNQTRRTVFEISKSDSANYAGGFAEVRLIRA